MLCRKPVAVVFVTECLKQLCWSAFTVLVDCSKQKCINSRSVFHLALRDEHALSYMHTQAELFTHRYKEGKSENVVKG